MKNKEEIIIVSIFFAVVIMLAMYMFISQQKNNNNVKKSNELEQIVKKETEDLRKSDEAIKLSIDSLIKRMDDTDIKYHNQ